MADLTRRNFILKAEMSEELAERLNQYLDEIREAVQTRIDITKTFETTTPPTADTEFRIIHKLGFIPNKFTQVSANGAGQLYRSERAWTTDAAYFKHTGLSIEIAVTLW